MNIFNEFEVVADPETHSFFSVIYTEYETQGIENFKGSIKGFFIVLKLSFN